MGLIAAFDRMHYVWSWRFRHWWHDTRNGQIARCILIALGIVVAIVEIVRMVVRTLYIQTTHEPQQAIYWWIIQLIIVIIAAALSYAMRPKPQNQKPDQGQSPSTDDGQAVKEVFGTVWIDDEFLLAWKVMGTVPIKSGGGKK